MVPVMDWDALLNHTAEAALEGTAVLEMLPHTFLAKKQGVGIGISCDFRFF